MDTTPTAHDAAAPLVRCPSCGDMKPYLRDNPYRPFCSKGCKAIDLGAWASEQYRVTPSVPDENLPDDLEPR